MIISTPISADLQAPGYPPIVHAVQGEQYSRQLKMSLYNGGVAWTVPGGVYVAMRYSKPDGTSGYYDTLPDGSQAWSTEGNTVSIYVAPQMLTVPGVVYGQLEIIQNQSILASFPLRLKVAANVAETQMESEDYVNWLQWMEDQIAQWLIAAAESGDFTGPQGPQGQKGDKGDKGDKGERGYTGSTGPQGPQGQKGDKGDKGDKGERGDTGSTGPQGPQGNTGDPATLVSSAVSYQASDSGTIVPSGTWSSSVPTVAQGKYLWTRIIQTFNTGSPVTFYGVSRMGMDGSGSVSSVCGQSPDSSGNVSLGASDVGALPTSGGTMTGAIAMGGNKITGLATPTSNADAATKQYADKMLPKTGGTMTGAIAMGGKKITGLGTPTASTDAATKAYVDSVKAVPACTTADNGKFLRVVSGVAAWQTVQNAEEVSV